MGKIKKIFCILLSICLAYSVNVNVLATEIKNQGKKFLNSSKEIEIDSAEDLLSMSNDLTATYTLVKNIDLKGKKWNPIGDNKKPFKGTFKGNGYKIFNFKINEKKEDNITDIGFFGVVENARISQLALENVSIYIKKNKKCSIGILAGKINQSQIANCFVKGSIKADISDNSDFGGIGGKALAVSKTNCSIKQCVLDVKIVNIRKKQLQKADVIGNVKNNCVIKNNYVYGQDSDKRRNEIQGNRILKKEERFKKENYNGFDFKNIWEITNKGIHLLKSVKKMESNNTKGKQETATLSTTEIKSAEVTKKARQKNVVAMQENLCGEYATYQIENGVLTISGKGKIDDNVFANDTGINSVIIEEGITEIGIRSFNNCSNLTEVKLPESLTTLGGLAFGNCQGLTSIKIPAGVKEVKEEWSNGGDRGPFYNCKNIKSAVLEKGMERIENRLLQDCTGLESVEIPEGIKEIGNYAFLNCSSLKEVKLPESLTTIGELAFGDCIGLTSIKIPAGVEEVKEGWSNGGNRGPFYNCKNIKSAVLEKGMERIENRLLQDCTGLESVEIPEGIKEIGNYAFLNCSSLKEVKLPESLTTIGELAFGDCIGLTSIKIPAGVKEVKEGWSNGENRGPFYNCKNIKSAVLEKGMERIENRLLQDCTGLESVEIPERVKEIGNCAFLNCNSLKEVKLPESLTTIGEMAFGNCQGLTSIKIPANVKEVKEVWWDSGDRGPFYKCENIESVTFEEGMEKIPSRLFQNCTGLKKINWPSTLKSIDHSAFGSCSSLEKVEIPEGVNEIGKYVFSDCSNLKEVKLPRSLTTLGGMAFGGCGLKSVKIPANVKEVKEVWWDSGDRGPFYKCENIESVTFEEGMEKIPSRLFQNCTGLKKINWPSTLKSIDHSAFGSCSSLEKVEIPEGVNEIGQYVFRDCSNLKEVKLPEGLTALGGMAFGNCPDLTSIKIPANVKEVKDVWWEGGYRGPFYKCKNIENVTLGEMEKIPSRLLQDCSNLEKIIIPDSVKSIENHSFANCEQLQKIYLSDYVSRIDDNVFDNSSKTVFYCNYDSYATVYAIEHDILFVSTGNSTGDVNKSILDKNNTSYYGDFNNMTANGYVAMNIKYSVKEEAKLSISNMIIRIKIPSGVDLEESSIKFDGKLCKNYTCNENGVLQIPIDKMSGDIKYSIKVKEQSNISSYATINFKRNNQLEKEIIGIINEKNDIFTIEAPEIVSSKNVSVSGLAPASSNIVIEIDGKKVDTALTSKAGNWSADLQLNNTSSYKEYNITAKCLEGNSDIEAKNITVTYHEGEPSLKSLKMYYNEHNVTKTCDLLKTNEITPVIYYLPGTKFDFEVSFENSEQIDNLYITSTRNNETKYLKAEYDNKKQVFTTDGYFDENNHNYIPGVISYEYKKKVPEVVVGNEEDWKEVKTKNSDSSGKSVDVKQNTDSDYKAQIDMSSFGEEFKDVIVDASITIFDEKEGTDFGVWKGLLEENDNILSYILPGYDDNKYICKLDYSDEGTWYMLIKDITGNKYIGLLLKSGMENQEDLDKYKKLSEISSTLSVINTASSILYKKYEIEKDMSKLRDEVMTSGSYSTAAELNKALVDVDNLEKDQQMFMLMTAILPLIVSAPIALGATMSAAPALLFTAILGTMTAASGVFWNIRKANIKGGKYKSKFIVDPSGYVYDVITGKRLENVLVTAYWIEYDESEDFWNKKPSDEEYGVKWKAIEYNQGNPLLTNVDGKYAWDVPEGWWRVKFEKKGYETTWSDWMTVPPLQTEVNIGMKHTFHEWDKGVITKKPTENNEGTKIYTCIICGQTKIEQIKATGEKNSKKQDNPSNTKNLTLKPGTKITDKSSAAIYKVTGKNTVEYVKSSSKKKAIVIPESITAKKIKYHVSSIAANAFKGNKKLKRVVISSNIRKIGRQAFFNCKNLRNITIKTPYLSKKTVGTKAFKGIHAKAKIKVPKKQKKAYQKLLKAKGVGKKATIK